MKRTLSSSVANRATRLLGGGSLAIALFLAGCSSTHTAKVADSDRGTNQADASTADQGNQKVVLTTFTVLADMAQTVAGDKIKVESITRVGAEIHGYEPTPSDITKAQDADLILYNGLDLERWFEKFLGSVKNVPTAVLTDGIQPIPIVEGPYTSKPNPHAWMSPRNGLVYVENIRKAFVELDPKNEATYNANAKAYSEKINAINTELENDLEQVPEGERYLVSCEGAFSYLTRDYDLKEIYMWPINAEQQFTPKQVKNVIEAVKDNNVATIFCESTANNEGQKQVAKTTGSRFGGNLYVDSLSTAEGPVPTYLDMLDFDARTISNGLLAGSKTKS